MCPSLPRRHRSKFQQSIFSEKAKHSKAHNSFSNVLQCELLQDKYQFLGKWCWQKNKRLTHSLIHWTRLQNIYSLGFQTSKFHPWRGVLLNRIESVRFMTAYTRVSEKYVFISTWLWEHIQCFWKKKYSELKMYLVIMGIVAVSRHTQQRLSKQCKFHT